MAIEDAMLLARTLQASNDITAALDHYQTTRIGRTTFVMLKSLARAKIFHAEDTKAQIELLGDTEEALGLFGYNPVTVPLDTEARAAAI